MTVTDQRLKTALRRYISPRFDDHVPFDKKMFDLELVIVERFILENNTAWVRRRANMKEPAFEVQVMSGMMSGDSQVTWIPDGNLTMNTKTRKTIVECKETVVGVVMAVEGNSNVHGSVLLGYVNMPVIEDKPPLEHAYTVKMGKTLFKITKSGIEVECDKFLVNGVEITPLPKNEGV